MQNLTIISSTDQTLKCLSVCPTFPEPPRKVLVAVWVISPLHYCQFVFWRETRSLVWQCWLVSGESGESGEYVMFPPRSVSEWADWSELGLAPSLLSAPSCGQSDGGLTCVAAGQSEEGGGRRRECWWCGLWSGVVTVITPFLSPSLLLPGIPTNIWVSLLS